MSLDAVILQSSLPWHGVLEILFQELCFLLQYASSVRRVYLVCLMGPYRLQWMSCSLPLVAHVSSCFMFVRKNIAWIGYPRFTAFLRSRTKRAGGATSLAPRTAR